MVPEWVGPVTTPAVQGCVNIATLEHASMDGHMDMDTHSY